MSKILLVEELKERERLTLMLLKSRLEMRGHSVSITEMNNIVTPCRTGKFDAVVLNSTNSVAEYLHNFLFAHKKTRIVNLHWEQILNPHSFKRYEFSVDIQKSFVDGRISWGPAFRSVLTYLNRRIDPARIGVVGGLKNTESTLLEAIPKTELFRLYPFNFAEYDKIILFATSFSLASQTDKKLKELRPKNPFINDLYRQHKRRQSVFMNAVQKASHKYKDGLIILRVHPAKKKEYYEYYQEVMNNNDNLVLSTAGPISPLIALSDLVVTSSSSVLIDAYIQRKPCINLRLRDDYLQHYGLLPLLHDQFGYQIYYDELEDVDLENYVGKPQKTLMLDSIIEKWVGKLDQAVYDAFVDFCEFIIRCPAVSKQIGLNHFRNHSVLRNLSSCVSEAVFRHRSKKNLGSASMKDFDYDKLYRLIVTYNSSLTV